MAVAPRGEDPAPAFARLAAARRPGARRPPRGRELSAGMSADLEAAVAAGATLVRVGTALFGDRPLPRPGIDESHQSHEPRRHRPTDDCRTNATLRTPAEGEVRWLEPCGGWGSTWASSRTTTPAATAGTTPVRPTTPSDRRYGRYADDHYDDATTATTRRRLRRGRPRVRGAAAGPRAGAAVGPPRRPGRARSASRRRCRRSAGGSRVSAMGSGPVGATRGRAGRARAGRRRRARAGARARAAALPDHHPAPAHLQRGARPSGSGSATGCRSS